MTLGHGVHSPILSSYRWISPGSKVELEFIDVEHKTGYQVAPAGSQWRFACILYTFFCKFQKLVTSGNTLVQTRPPNSIVVCVPFHCTPQLGTEGPLYVGLGKKYYLVLSPVQRSGGDIHWACTMFISYVGSRIG